MSQIFRYLASVINIYSFICFVRIFLTWFPQANYSRFGRILSSICDPYLNFFRRFSFLRLRALDFSPAVALCVLFGLSTIFSGLSTSKALSVGYFLALFLNLIWALVSSIVNFIAVLLIIRLIAFAVMRFISRRNGYRPHSPLWDQLDSTISPFIFKISGIFVRRVISFTTALVISIVFLIVSVQVGKILVKILSSLLVLLPF